MKKTICKSFPITNIEYKHLDKEFGLLCKHASWDLLKRNSKNNHTDDFEDINQELLSYMIVAGSYYKRQVYIEGCFIKSIEAIGGDKAFELLNEIIKMSKPNDSLRQEAKAAIARMAGTELVRSKNEFLLFVLRELVCLWHNRTRHGANRQKFGYWQERILEKIVNAVVPKAERPHKKQLLTIDDKFSRYCKSIIWNAQKNMGRKITREKSIRANQVSLSEHNHLS